MDKCVNSTINSLLQDDLSSVGSDSDFKTLCKAFDKNYEKWESLPPGDLRRKVLVQENEKLMRLILAG
ncbi:MAG: hypothetical protein A4E25_00042 [Methanobacterium sp. PtaB.Bin024]|nr:MAG: hypothetical protein A4E25_00042 [Methanobacterium sp. PtaB.Bin024]